MDNVTRLVLTVLLLIGSNVFMNFAWYGHLKFKESAMWAAILASWGIAFFEYCLQVPANRIGHGLLTATQLKILQEVITIVVFLGIAVLYLGETIRWNYIAGFVCILLAVVFVFAVPNPDAPRIADAPTAAVAESPPSAH